MSKRHWMVVTACLAAACAPPDEPSARLEAVLGLPSPGPSAPVGAASPSPKASPSPSSSPKASPSPKASGSPPPVIVPYARLFPGVGVGTGSPRPQLDIVLYDRDHGALHRLEPPSTVQADEFFPSFSAKARYMVYTTTAPGNADIWRLDLKTMLIDTLPQMNSPGNALRAAVSDDGNLIAFSEADGDRTVLKLYDVITNFLSVPEAPNRFGTNVLVRDVAPNGHVIAYSVINDGQADIELYDVARGIIVTPPFINSGFNDLSPTFSPDGTQLVFVSDRFGSLDIMLVDLLTGMLDTLPLANSPQADVDPVFLPDGEIAFQTNRAGEPDLFFYDVRTQLLDTAPIANPDDDPNFGASPGPG